MNPTDKLHPSTEITVPDLKEGKKCEFRIYAVNAAGISEPARTADILVQDILSKSLTQMDHGTLILLLRSVLLMEIQQIWSTVIRALNSVFQINI